MTYSAVYCALITKRLNNPITKDDCYCETHHIIPKSEGGLDEPDNLVNLTAREHYIAHLLLARIYDDQKMWCAMNRLIHGNEFRKYNRVSSRMYQTLKENFRNSLLGHHNGLGKKRTKESKERIRQAKLGNKNPMYGKKQSEETKRKRSQALMGHHGYWTGKRMTKETIEKMSVKQRGMRWFNNGTINTKAKVCPEGFVAGRLKKNKGK